MRVNIYRVNYVNLSIIPYHNICYQREVALQTLRALASIVCVPIVVRTHTFTTKDDDSILENTQSVLLRAFSSEFLDPLVNILKLILQLTMDTLPLSYCYDEDADRDNHNTHDSDSE